MDPGGVFANAPAVVRHGGRSANAALDPFRAHAWLHAALASQRTALICAAMCRVGL